MTIVTDVEVCFLLTIIKIRNLQKMLHLNCYIKNLTDMILQFYSILQLYLLSIRLTIICVFLIYVLEYRFLWNPTAVYQTFCRLLTVRFSFNNSANLNHYSRLRVTLCHNPLQQSSILIESCLRQLALLKNDQTNHKTWYTFYVQTYLHDNCHCFHLNLAFIDYRHERMKFLI